jgi:hypothetical protein
MDSIDKRQAIAELRLMNRFYKLQKSDRRKEDEERHKKSMKALKGTSLYENQLQRRVALLDATPVLPRELVLNEEALRDAEERLPVPIR